MPTKNELSMRIFNLMIKNKELMELIKSIQLTNEKNIDIMKKQQEEIYILRKQGTNNLF